MEPDVPAPDTIAGGDPIVVRWSRHRLVGIVAIVLGVVAASATGAAVHYHRQVTRLNARVTAAASPAPSFTPQTRAQTPTATVTAAPPSPPPLSIHSYDLTTVGQLRATIYLTTETTDGVGLTQGQLLITALIRGARPSATYSLNGGDCQTNSNVVWAQGVADATGTAFLAGKEWMLPKADSYTLELDASPPGTSPAHPGPGIEGDFVLGQASLGAQCN